MSPIHSHVNLWFRFVAQTYLQGIALRKFEFLLTEDACMLVSLTLALLLLRIIFWKSYSCVNIWSPIKDLSYPPGPDLNKYESKLP